MNIAQPGLAPTIQAAQQVRGSTFYHALRILPHGQREAMYEIYAFCREVDDIADTQGPPDRRLLQLDAWRAEIEAIFSGGRVARAALARAAAEFNLSKADFIAVIDGMAMDVAQDIRAPTWATLDLYCDRVACAVGRLSVRIFGVEAEAGIALAHHLGRALQLTNILRDIDEDAELGRLYLPREALAGAGVLTDDPAAAANHPAIATACAPVVAAAHAEFAAARALLAKIPRRAGRTPRIMAAAYGEILERLESRGWSAPRAPIKLSKWRLLGLILRVGWL